MARDGLQVAIGRFTQARFRSFEQTGLLGAGNAFGLMHLSAFFSTLNLPYFTIAMADQMGYKDLQTNLILLGGPDSNSVTQRAVRRIENNIHLKFGNPYRHQISLEDMVTGQVYVPSNLSRIGTRERATELGQPAFMDGDQDYCAIIKTLNPFNPSKYLLLIAGSFGYGTWAGVQYVTSANFLSDPIVLSNTLFECLIVTTVYKDEPQDIYQLALRSLAKPENPYGDMQQAEIREQKAREEAKIFQEKQQEEREKRQNEERLRQEGLEKERLKEERIKTSSKELKSCPQLQEKIQQESQEMTLIRIFTNELFPSDRKKVFNYLSRFLEDIVVQEYNTSTRLTSLSTFFASCRLTSADERYVAECFTGKVQLEFLSALLKSSSIIWVETV